MAGACSLRLPGLRSLALALFALVLTAPVSPAQDRLSTLQSNILLIDSDAAFAGSQLGQSIAAEIEASSRALATENRELEATLIDEEQQLTEQRKTMAPDAFRALADAFDEKVRKLRSEQDAKARALGQKSEEGRRRFLLTAKPVLEEIMLETGAVAIIETRFVFVSDEIANITPEVIRRLDAADAERKDATDPAAPPGGDQ
ncbi:OmpH family outer membrane protein [Pseudooceanicola sp.]|uniref:OmpH family outer membrane protein n=1 Tax=Pseudooceanicola sp. TaxID=1914328 RepID=UPI00262B5269|nr:OmpH family outer membrane protein [Pseudooceanicola sp.]MDF1855808.1 OmpH family outer membrane protein [Pseudooceanicola sp.]